MDICTKIENQAWEPHPLAKGVAIKPLVTKRDHDLDVSCILVKIPAGDGLMIFVDTDEHRLDRLKNVSNNHSGSFP